MNLTIKDLSTSIELDREAMIAVRGGDANSAVQSILQAQDVMVPVANGSYFGAGSGGASWPRSLPSSRLAWSAWKLARAPITGRGSWFGSVIRCA